LLPTSIDDIPGLQNLGTGGVVRWHILHRCGCQSLARNVARHAAVVFPVRVIATEAAIEAGIEAG